MAYRFRDIGVQTLSKIQISETARNKAILSAAATEWARYV